LLGSRPRTRPTPADEDDSRREADGIVRRNIPEDVATRAGAPVKSMAHRAEPRGQVRERAAPMAVRRGAMAASKPAVPSAPFRRKRTIQVAPPTPQRATVPLTIRGWDAATTHERQRRLIVAGIVAAAVAALVLSGFIGGFGRGTVADTDGQLPAGITAAGPAAAQAGSQGVEATPAASPVRGSPNPRATHLASSAGGVAPVAKPSPIPAVATNADTTSLQPGSALLGSATIDYDVGPENGDGVNVSIPLQRLDGLVLKPGDTFNFWKAVGEVSRRAGYKLGGIIVGDHLEPRGALAGGICIASSAVFGAAARSGLAIVTRRNHGGYLAKYPLGLDAAVTKSGGARQDLIFRNDTNAEIVVRTHTAPGVARVDLYSAAPTGLTVSMTAPVIGHRQPAHDRVVRTSGLARGTTRRVEPKSDGMTVSVERTVRDATGQTVHHDTWISVYRPLTGLLQVGAG
jgi:vancomycin resistance protein YoaR